MQTSSRVRDLGVEWMSIGFDIIRRPAGWRLEFGSRLDLSNWDIAYSPGKISCTPRPVEFMTMALGTILFVFLAVFVAALAINPAWLSRSPRVYEGSLRFEQGATISLTMLQLLGESRPARSKFQHDAAAEQEMRESTSRMLDQLTKDMTAEEKTKFMAEIKRRSSQRVSKLSADNKDLVAWLLLVARIMAILPVALCSLLGGACLYRALLYCRDRIVLSVRQNAILFERPKLLVGIHERVFPFEQLAAISGYAVRHSGRRGVGAYVKWNVQLMPGHPFGPTMVFDIEHLPFNADMTTPTRRVRAFASAIHELSGLPVIVRRPSQ